ncbi:hypothetical protein CEUSTIGMA_g2917.t1 [Chlamydomonas eustigma]|uniref:VLRF1 domain-containing protein n=1 Tax=Chlamydomonas eustigma TaxID=1157962 RepID=A0A250WXB4_9CHLO|nr:hypothetical protein CEUSTIGMA_g2917.t1 [Chlamydomonas eustigma]|eukprot:GAX75474.1 hypothetical protein CEUSTIGMA_g2917.t1 [Chlamydomonas eustigma]
MTRVAGNIFQLAFGDVPAHIDPYYNQGQVELVQNHDHDQQILKENDEGERQHSPEPSTGPSIAEQQSSKWNESGATCIACGIGIALPGFNTSTEQREHFKTDWHRYNVKRRLANQPPASEKEFDRMVEVQEVSSISGSSSDEDDDVVSLRPFPEADEELETSSTNQSRQHHNNNNNQGPQHVFQYADERYLAVWRCLLLQDHLSRAQAAGAASDPDSLQEQLKQLVSATASTQLWVVIMLRGGHFAAAVLRRSRNAAAAGARKFVLDPAGDPFEVVDHRTFHRYVVRAKAGGKQSSKDGKFHSAGSRLRAYNEFALEKDVQELLHAWSPHLAAAQLIFVSAPSSNSKAVFGTAADRETSPLSSSDPRVRRVPFMTQRPTFSEVKRVVRVLASVFEIPSEVIEKQRQQVLEAEAAAAAHADSQRQQKAEQREAATKPVPSTLALQIEALQDAPIGRSMPLHRAARSGDADRVTMLLTSGRHDPSVKDEQGRTPYALAADKAVRDAFRRYMAQNPGLWNYTASGVPSALTEDMEAAQLAKKAEKKAKLKAKEKERKALDEERKRAATAAAAEATAKEIEQAAAEAAALSSRLSNMRTPIGTSSSSSSKVGGSAGGRGRPISSTISGRGGSGGRNQQQKQQAPLTPEEMARRRETMAAAAETRMRALQQQAQQQQLWLVA